MTERTCDIEGCGNAHHSRGWCQVHYARWQRHGSPTHPLQVRGGRTCDIDGCGNTHESRGWCSMHYQRFLRYGSPTHQVRLRRFGAVCSLSSCDRPHFGRGWCGLHYSRWYHHGLEPEDVPARTRSEAGAESAKAFTRPVGSTRIDQHGYIVEKVGRDSPHAPMANQKGWALQHRVVMARKMGRMLTPKETVHHINGIRDDNRPENLELWESHHPPGQRKDDPHCASCTCMAKA